AVVGLEHAMEVREKRAVGPPSREVRGPVAGREAPLGAPLGDEEALPLLPVPAVELDAPRLRRRERHAVRGSEPHRPLAASPAAVAGRPSHDPTGDSDPSAPTAQPKTRRPSASTA